MTYEEAFKQKPGDKVKIIETGERLSVKEIDGHTTSIFLILEDGCTYHHSQVTK